MGNQANVLAYLLCAISFVHINANTNICIVESEGKPSYYYQTFIDCSKNAGAQQIQFLSLYDVLDCKTIDACPIMVWFLTSSLLNALDQQPFSIIAKAVKNAITPSTHTIVLGIPTSRTNTQLQERIVWLIQTISDIPLNQDQISGIHLFLQHISQAPGHAHPLAETTLLPASTNTSCSSASKTLYTQTESEYYDNIPHSLKTVDQIIQPVCPVGFVVKHPTINQRIIIMPTHFVRLLEVAEYCTRTPYDPAIQTKYLHLLINCLQCFFKTYPTKNSPAVPYRFTEQYTTAMQRVSPSLAKYEAQFTKPIKCAWLDLFDFKGNTDEIQKYKEMSTEQKKDFFLNSTHSLLDCFSILWLECLPEWFLSKQGIKKNETLEYFEFMKTFMQFLQKQNPTSSLFVGMNVTSNFAQHLPKHSVQDIFGTLYTKIPSPLDYDEVWKSEVVDVFSRYYKELEKPKIINGIFIDLEMYHAQEQASAYTDTMDFSDFAWQLYCTQNQLTQHAHLAHKDRILFLSEHKKFNDYIGALTNTAENLGKQLQYDLQTLSPNIQIGVYLPCLPSSWFYRGFLRGLSSAKPILCTTFNSCYLPHKNWLHNKEKIQCLHSSAIMLSKLKSLEDKKLLSLQKARHDFLWFNRPSRQLYRYNAQELTRVWWGIEASPLSNEILRELIDDE